MADFFEQVDSMGVVESHIKALEGLEADQAKRVLTRYKEIRQDLRDRLDLMGKDTFSAQQLRGVLVQVETAIDAMGKSVLGEMKGAALKSSTRGAEDLIKEIKTFEDYFRGAVVPINVNAVAIATDTSNFLFNQYESSISSYSEGLRSDLATQITQSAIEEIPYSTLIQRMGQYFIGEEWKLHRIARTELHSVYNLAKLNTMGAVQEDTLPDLQKTLIHPMDARTGDDSKKAARLDLIVDIDKPFKYAWAGKMRIFMTPPDRPNDRSILCPYRKSWS